METNRTPAEYKKEIDSWKDQKIEEASRKAHQLISDVEAQRPKKPDTEFGSALIIMGSPFLAFFACVGICTSTKSVGSGVLAFFVTLVLGMACGLGFGKLQKSSYEDEINRIKSQENDIYDDLAKANKKITQEAERKFKEYEDAYNQKLAIEVEKSKQVIQKKSVQLANSQLAQEVIQYITKDMITTIDCADRKNYVEKISVPCPIMVYGGCITWHSRKYDFLKHRCKNLPSQEDRAALLHAIVSTVELNLVMKYTKDPSGTTPQIRITYDDPDPTEPNRPYEKAVLRYSARNGNYEPARDW